MSQENMGKSDDGAAIAQVFGQRLAERMRVKGLDDRSLAEKVGVTRQCVSRWRSGGGRPPRAKIALLAKVLGVPESYLLGFPAMGQLAAKIAREKPAQAEPALFGGAESESADGKKGTRARFWLSAEELRLLQEHCEKSGETVSAFVRQVVLARLLGEKDRRLRVDLDELALRRLSLASELYGEAEEQIAARILRDGLLAEFRALGKFCGDAWRNMGEEQRKEALSYAEKREARAGEPAAAERAF